MFKIKKHCKMSLFCANEALIFETVNDIDFTLTKIGEHLFMTSCVVLGKLVYLLSFSVLICKKEEGGMRGSVSAFPPLTVEGTSDFLQYTHSLHLSCPAEWKLEKKRVSSYRGTTPW